MRTGGVRDDARGLLMQLGGCFKCGFFPYDQQTDARKHGRGVCKGTPGVAVVEGKDF